MKIISWNVNGLKNITKKKTLRDLVLKEDPDVVCIQELRCDCWETTLSPEIKEKYPHVYENAGERKGYSGTLVFMKKKPLKVVFPEFLVAKKEGRVITIFMKEAVIVNVYTPNSKRDLDRLAYRCEEWEPEFRKYINSLKQKRDVIVCGDLNVAFGDLDIHNPKGTKKRAGWTDAERLQMKLLIEECDLVDTYRHFHPTGEKYSYWSNFAKARENGKGWRIDYFLVSSGSEIMKKIKDADIYEDVMGSDHAPIVLEW